MPLVELGYMQRRVIVVDGPLSFRMRRLEAARACTVGLEILSLPLLAAPPGGEGDEGRAGNPSVRKFLAQCAATSMATEGPSGTSTARRAHRPRGPSPSFFDLGGSWRHALLDFCTSRSGPDDNEMSGGVVGGEQTDPDDHKHAWGQSGFVK